MGLAGKYEYQSSENLKELLTRLATQVGKDASAVEEYAAKFTEVKSTVEIKPDGTKYTLISTHLGKAHPITFELGKEYDDNFPGSPKSTASVSGDVLEIVSNKDGKVIGKRIYTATADGLVVVLHSEISGFEAKIVYKRL